MSLTLDTAAGAISRYPLPQAFVKIPQAISYWIDQVAPCLAAGVKQSRETTDAVIDHLRRQGVSDDVIAGAFILNSYAFDFSSSSAQSIGIKIMIATMPQPSRSGVPPAPQMTSISPGEARGNMINTARVLDQRYKGAIASSNRPLMRAILKALIDLLSGAGEGFDEMRKDKEKLEEVQEEIMRNAPTAGRAIRFLPRPPPGGGGGRVRQVGPDTYVEVEEDIVEEQAEEGDGEAEGD
jgi:hypothetical protein